MRVFTNNPKGFDSSIKHLLENAQQAGAFIGVRCLHQRSKAPAIPQQSLRSNSFHPFESEHLTLSDEGNDSPKNNIIPEGRWSKFKRLLARSMGASTKSESHIDPALLQTVPFLKSFLPTSLFQRLDVSIAHPNAIFNLQSQPIKAQLRIYNSFYIVKNFFKSSSGPINPKILEHLNFLDDNSIKAAHIHLPYKKKSPKDDLSDRFFISLGSKIPFSYDPSNTTATAEDISSILFHEIGHAVQMEGRLLDYKNNQQLELLGVGTDKTPSVLKEPINQRQLEASKALYAQLIAKIDAFSELNPSLQKSLIQQAKEKGLYLPEDPLVYTSSLNTKMANALFSLQRELFADAFQLCTQTTYKTTYTHDFPSSLAFIRNRPLTYYTYDYKDAEKNLYNKTQPYESLSSSLPFGHHTTHGVWIAKQFIEKHLDYRQPNNDSLNLDSHPNKIQNSQSTTTMKNSVMQPNQNPLSYEQSSCIAQISADVGWSKEFAALYLSDPTLSQSFLFLNSLEFNPQTGKLFVPETVTNQKDFEDTLQLAAGEAYFTNIKNYIPSLRQLQQIIDHYGAFNQSGGSIETLDYNAFESKLHHRNLFFRNKRVINLLADCAQFSNSDVLQKNITLNQEDLSYFIDRFSQKKPQFPDFYRSNIDKQLQQQSIGSLDVPSYKLPSLPQTFSEIITPKDVGPIVLQPYDLTERLKRHRQQTLSSFNPSPITHNKPTL